MTLQQLLLILRARVNVVLFVLLVTVVAALVVSLALPKQYTARTAVVVDVKSPDPIAGTVLPGMISPSYMATQVDIIASDRVAQRVVKALRMDEDPAVSISARNGEELVLLKSLSKETTTQQGANISAPAFRKTLEDKYRYLLLVVNTTNKKKDTHLKVASGEGLPLDEIIGTYDINYETSASVTINNYIARDGDSLVLSDSDGFNEPATLSYDPLKGIAYGKHTYSKVYATGVNEITVTYKLYFTRENGGITMTGVGSQTINGNPAGSWSYNETKIN